MASFSARNPHGGKPPPPPTDFLDLPMGEVVRKRWEAAVGANLMVEAKKRFTVSVGEKQYVLADIRLVKHLVDPSKDSSSLPLEFFFDGVASDVDFDRFNAAFEAKVEEQLQERRMHVFRQTLDTRRRKGRQVVEGDAEGGEFDAADVDDDSWKAYLSQRAEKTGMKIEATREAGCMLTFIAIRCSLSVSACQTLGEVSWPEYFASAKEAEEAVAKENELPLPRWIWAMGFLFFLTFLACLFATTHLIQAVPRIGK